MKKMNSMRAWRRGMFVMIFVLTFLALAMGWMASAWDAPVMWLGAVACGVTLAAAIVAVLR